MPQNRVGAIELLSFSSADLTGGYDVFTTGLEAACFYMRFLNDSGSVVFVSYDGVTDADYLHYDFPLELNFQANSRPGNKIALMGKGQPIWLRGAAGQGTIYLAGNYSLLR